MLYANIINVKSKNDIINNYKSMKSGKPVFVAVTSTPELVEIKIREDIRSLGLFRSDHEYDIITGSSISVKSQLVNKGYLSSSNRKRQKKNYSLIIRSTCSRCDRFLTESVENITEEKYTQLKDYNEYTDNNIIMHDETNQKCITC